MPNLSFDEKLRHHLASEEFDERIESFLRKHAKKALKGSEFAEAKSSDAVEGEFTLEANDIWNKYLSIIEDHMKILQEEEEMSDKEFKKAVQKVGEKNPFLVRLMLASWEFVQFIDICRDFVQGQDDGGEEEDADEEKVIQIIFHIF